MEKTKVGVLFGLTFLMLTLVVNPANGGDRKETHGHIGNFNFMLEIEGVTVGAFEDVEGIGSETEVIEYQDGDDLVLRKRPGRTKYSNLVLKGGYGDTMDKLWQWRETVIAGKVERKSGAVILYDKSGAEIRRYNFKGAWPCKWEGVTLDGKGSDVNVEEMELVVETINRCQ